MGAGWEKPNAGVLRRLGWFFAGRLVAVEDVQFLARLEANSFTRRNRHFGSGARVSADARLAGPHVEDAEAAQLDAVAVCQGLLKALKNCVDRSFCLHAR